jgi:hypothetical protein
MCGGTWPPTRGELLARTDEKLSLDGAADLIDAAFSVVPRRKTPKFEVDELCACISGAHNPFRYLSIVSARTTSF